MNYVNSSAINPITSFSSHVAELAQPLHKLGITYFSYSRINKDGARIYLNSSHGVIDQYLRGGYYLSGNTEGCPLHNKRQITLWDTLPNQKIFDDVARAHNHDHGMFIIEPGKDYCDYYGFATNKGNTNIINTYLSKLDHIHSFIEYFNDHGKHLIDTANKNKIILPFSYYHIDFTENDLIPDEAVTVKHSTITAKFTSRQYDVAVRFVDGKSIKTIAKEMKLSPRTIEQHINTLKHKLDCVNSIELAVKLAQLIYR